MAAAPIFLHRSPVDCLADDLLGLLQRIEADQAPVMNEADQARRDATKHVIGQVCDVIDRHLFKELQR